LKAEEFIKENDLGSALAALKKEVAAQPENAELRWFLFQLFSFCGDFQRAANQLDLAAQLDKSFESAALIYSRVLAAERLRLEVASGARTPLLLGEPSEWLAQLSESNRLLADGQVEASSRLRQDAFDGMPASAGKFNGTAFAWLSDQDTRFGANLECFMNGKYYWISFAQIKSITISEAPVSYTDLLFPKAKLLLRTEAELDVMLFSRYPGVYSESEPALAMNQLTEWDDINDYTAIGRGQRMLCSDVGEHPILDLRELVFE
jgi:type VI secretion system protein ImpE